MIPSDNRVERCRRHGEETHNHDTIVGHFGSRRGIFDKAIVHQWWKDQGQWDTKERSQNTNDIPKVIDGHDCNDAQTNHDRGGKDISFPSYFPKDSLLRLVADFAMETKCLLEAEIVVIVVFVNSASTNPGDFLRQCC